MPAETAAAPVARPLPVYFYSSSSGMTRRFAERLAARGRPVHDLSARAVRRSVPTSRWVLLAPSYKAGNAGNATLPRPVLTFLTAPITRRRMVGIIGAGNRNLGACYQAAARRLARLSGRPVLYEVELSGTEDDAERCEDILRRLDAALHPES